MSGQRALCPDCGVQRGVLLAPFAKHTKLMLTFSVPCACGSTEQPRIVQTLELVPDAAEGRVSP